MASHKYAEMVEWIETHEPGDEHPDFPVDDWKRAVASDQFREGYQEWLLTKADQMEASQDEDH